MKKAVKLSLYTLAALVVLIQLYPKAERNIQSSIPTTDIRNEFSIPDNIINMLESACYDCHSNNTNYPWYSNLQPVRYFMDEHVEHGKDELNFSEFASYSTKRKIHKLEEVTEEVEEGHMPISSYLSMHPEAKLSPEETAEFVAFFEGLVDGFEAATTDN